MNKNDAIKQNQQNPTDDSKRNFMQVPVMTKPIPVPKEKMFKQVNCSTEKKDT